MGRELSMCPVFAVCPRDSGLDQSFLDEFRSLVDEVEGNAAPLASLLNACVDTLFAEKCSLVESDVGRFAAADEFEGIVANFFGRADEDDVVDVSVDCLTFPSGEVEEEECRGLRDVAALPLAHGEPGGFEVLVCFAETEEIADAVLVGELIVVGREIECSEM